MNGIPGQRKHGQRWVFIPFTPRHARPSKPRLITPGLVLAVLLLTAVLSLIAVLAAGKAAAASTKAVVSVSVDQRAEAITVPALASTPVDGHYGASLWVGYPGDSTFTLAGSGVSRTSSVVIRARLDARRITSWGHLDATVVDDGDGSTQAIVLDVRRRSVVRGLDVTTDGGKVRLGTRVSHYSPGRGYIASRLSPVRFQEFTHGAWKTIGTATTNADGLAGVILPVTTGAHQYRAIRLAGATVWGAKSPMRRVFVPGC